MRKFLFAAALSVAAPLYVHTDASARCRPFAERRADRKAKAAPVRVVMPFVSRAVVAPVALVLRAVLPSACANGVCPTK